MHPLHACFSVRGVLVLAALYALLSATPTHAQYDVQRVTPPPGKALVFVFRKDQVPLPAPVPALVNSERLGQLTNNTFVTATINPGATRVRIGDRVQSTLDFIATPNQRYFVRVDALYGVSIVQTKVQLASEQEGLRALEQSRLVGGTLPALAVAPQPSVSPPPPAPRVAPTPPPAPPVVSSAPAPRIAKPAPAPAPAPKVSSPTEPDRTSEFVLILSSGTFTMSNGSQVVGGFQSSYNTASKSPLNVQLERRNKTGLSFGGEIYSYSNDIATTGGAPDAKQDTRLLLANAKYYFPTTGSLRPFVGAGIGYASTSYSGNLTGSATGLAYQGLAGAELRFNRMGLYLQYKYLAATVGSSEKLEVGGSGILAGIGFIF